MLIKTLPEAQNSASRVEPFMRVHHSIETEKLPKQSELVFLYDGDNSYTNSDDYKVRIGIKGAYKAYPSIKNDKEWYACLEYLRQHEICHLLYTGGESYKEAANQAVYTVLQYFADQEGDKITFRKERDVENYAYALSKRYNLNFMQIIQEIVGAIVNALEDGRIERIRSAKSPGFAAQRTFARGMEYQTSKSVLPEIDDVMANPSLHFILVMDQILSLALWQVFQKGFAMKYSGTVVMDEVNELMPHVVKAYLGRETKDMIEPVKEIARITAPLYYNAFKQGALNEEQRNAIQQFVKSLLEQMAGDGNYGSDCDKQADDTQSMKTAFPKSDMEVTLDDETYDKLVDNMKSSSGDDDGINIKREHPLTPPPAPSSEEEGESSDSDGEGNSEGSKSDENTSSEKSESSEGSATEGNSSSNGEGTDSEQSEGNETGAAGEGGEERSADSEQKAGNGGQSGDSAEQSDSDESSASGNAENGEQTSGNQNKSGAGSGMSESEIDKAIAEAASKVNAEGERQLQMINQSAIRSNTARSKKAVVEDKSDLVSANDVREICSNFKETRRKYKTDMKLPADLQQKGDVLRRKIQSYFKSLMEPSVRHKRNGMLDSRSLSRLAKNNINVFMKKGKSKMMQGCVYILIDNSGSMYGAKKLAACRAAAVIEEGFKGIMPLKIVAFDEEYSVIHEIIKNWDEITAENGCWNYAHKSRYGGGNEDDKDILVATKEILARPEQKKIIIVLSDGAPADTDATRDAISYARSKGVHVSGIYFEEGRIGSDADRFEYMYQKDYIICTERDLENELSKVLIEFAHSAK